MDRGSAAIRLFVPDLPETTDAMIAGGVYAMIAETPPARFALLASSMAGAVAGNTVTTLVLPSSPKLFIDRLIQVGFPGAEDAIETGHLQVFQLQDDFSKKMFRFGAEAFINELDHFKLPANGYLVIDQADELLSLHDISLAVEQAEALGEWARKLKVTILLMFTRVAAVSASMATLTGLMDYLSGLARLGGHQDGLDLTFEYWQSPDGTVAAKMYQLVIRDDGRYQVKKPEAAPVELPQPGATGTATADVMEPEEPAAELRYLYIDPTLAGLARQMVGQWQACDSLGSVIRAAFGARAPTVLLSFERSTVLRELAEAVHTLRLSLGRRARIVVVEREASLRYQNEILLLRLGTSLVVHRDVQENRIPLMLESLRGQIFNRDIEMNFDAALSSVVTSAKRGYLPPASFVRETVSIVDRSDLLNLPCALVVAKPDSTRACTELLTRVRVTRAGDLTSTDGRLCFIFFSGCPESSLKRALQAVLGDDIEHLFTDMQFFVQRPDISKRLKALALDAQGRTFPDTIVQTITPKAVEAKPEPVAAQAPAPAPVASLPAPTAAPVAPVQAPPSAPVLADPTAETVMYAPSVILPAPTPAPVVAPAVDIDFDLEPVAEVADTPAPILVPAPAPAPAPAAPLDPAPVLAGDVLATDDTPPPTWDHPTPALPVAAAEEEAEQAWAVDASPEPAAEALPAAELAMAPAAPESPAAPVRTATPAAGVLNRLFAKNAGDARAARVAQATPVSPAPLPEAAPPVVAASAVAAVAEPVHTPAPTPQADPPHVFGLPAVTPSPTPARALRRAVRVSTVATGDRQDG